ncbi:MAG: response regulator [Candidatus Eisenbacteria bacterium]|nr:response regulator [Candidatus Eisenbacteria bacterium]
MGRILVVEDNETLREGIAEVLREAGHQVTAASSAEEAWQHWPAEPSDLVLTDLKLPGRSGLDVLREVKGREPLVEVILLTAYGTIEVAVEAMRAGAFDFLIKPIRMEHLVAKIDQALQVHADRLALGRERERREYLEEEIGEAYNAGEIIGRSAPMQALYATIDKVARADSSILITGESGTGKELVARAIHLRSPRRAGPFIRVHCGALSEGVLESELFGHERGAFTGAVRRRRGRFELAEGGTLFLDEIADVGPAVQVRLLRVLQEREFERVGGEETLRSNVRVVAATNRDMQAAVASGEFREDLFYRLYVIPIHLPPLRERKDDIPLLTEHFLERLAQSMGRSPVRIRDGAMRLLTLYDWPGNVRELENALERALVLCDGEEIDEGDLVSLMQRSAPPRPWMPEGIRPLKEAVEALERTLLERALEQSQGIKAEAARLLDLKPSALYYKLEKYGLHDRVR